MVTADPRVKTSHHADPSPGETTERADGDGDGIHPFTARGPHPPQRDAGAKQSKMLGFNLLRLFVRFG